MNPPSLAQLWISTQNGDYPPGITAATLATHYDADGYSLLHTAAILGKLPPNTTAPDLARCKNNKNWTALHAAAAHGCLPPNTTRDVLKNTIDNNGDSAWDLMVKFAFENPGVPLQFPPQWFQNDHATAVKIVEQAITVLPSLKNAAAIWLGHVLGKSNPPQPYREP